MAFLGSILRSRRGDFNLFLIAALVALLVVPGATHAVMPPQSCEAVLMWLHNETSTVVAAPAATASSLLSISHQQVQRQHQSPIENHYSVATFHCARFSMLSSSHTPLQAQLVPGRLSLERHVVAHLSGVRTNRRLI